MDRVLSLIQTLPGFYLAALAAVATFDRPGMDKVTAGDPLIGPIRMTGGVVMEALTRRRLLCMMFSYLVALSLIVALVGTMGVAVAAPVSHLLHEAAIFWLRLGVMYVFLLLVWQMVTITLWGLFYLGDRVHTP